jgi:hypothetical protein
MSLSPLDLLTSALRTDRAGSSTPASSDFNLATGEPADSSAINAEMKRIGRRIGGLGDRNEWLLKQGSGERETIRSRLDEAQFEFATGSDLSPKALQSIDKSVRELDQLIEKNPNPSQAVVDQAAKLIDNIEAQTKAGATSGPLVGSQPPKSPSPGTPGAVSGATPPLVGSQSNGADELIGDFKTFSHINFRRGGEKNFSSLASYGAFEKRFGQVEKAMTEEQKSGDLSAEDQTFLKEALGELNGAWKGKPNDQELFKILGKMEDRLNIMPPTGPSVPS